MPATAHAAWSAGNCAAAKSYSAEHDGVTFLVMQNGRIVCEDYPNGGRAEQPYLLALGTKSFSSIIAAAAAQDGLLSLDERVSDTITEWKGDPPREVITVRQLIGLVGGILAADRVYDGVDLVPFVEGQAKGVPHDALMWRRQPLVSIRKGEWKLWKHLDGDYTLLFNLKDDPNEANNLAAKYPEKVREL